jgi:hypothetical protein
MHVIPYIRVSSEEQANSGAGLARISHAAATVPSTELRRLRQRRGIRHGGGILPRVVKRRRRARDRCVADLRSGLRALLELPPLHSERLHHQRRPHPRERSSRGRLADDGS